MFVMTFHNPDNDNVFYFVTEEAAVAYAEQLMENGYDDYIMIQPEDEYMETLVA